MSVFAKVDGKDVGDIRVFALSTCVWCKKVKKYFDDNNIAYSFVDVDLLSGAKRDEVMEMLQKHNPNGGFPITVLNDEEAILGYSLPKLNNLIGVE